jgi:N-acetylmuramoyl-L-alanine amidase
MRPEAVDAADIDRRSGVEELALTLLALGGDQSVRVIEALAATLVNRRGRPSGDRVLGLCELPSPGFWHAEPACTCREMLKLCRRVARRALRGSLADLTLGAGAFHRFEDNPDWARDLLPVASFGSFLFYQLPAPERADPCPGSYDAVTYCG